MLPSLHVGRVVVCFYKRISCLSPCSRIQTQDRFISDICRKISSQLSSGSTECYVEEKQRQSHTLWNGPNKGDYYCVDDLEQHGFHTVRNCLIRKIDCDINLKKNTDCFIGGTNHSINVKKKCAQYDSYNRKETSLNEFIVDDCCCNKGPVTTKNVFNSDTNHIVSSDYSETSLKSNNTIVFHLSKPFLQDLFHITKKCFAEQKHKLLLTTNIGNKKRLFSKTAEFHTQVCRHFSGFTACNYIYSPINSSFNRNIINKVTLRNISKKDYKFPDFNEEDISETFQRGDGPGGQATAKTNNCCVLTHHPTGIVIRCHETRVLEKNRAKAREKLREQLDVYYNGENSFLAIQQKEGIEHRSKKRDRSRKRLEMKKAWKENIQKDMNTDKDEKE